jgi:hypothetical protein
MPKDTATGETATSPEAIRARIADFCEWFDVEPVKLKVRNGAVYMVDELLAWCRDNGASLDWIICGEAKAMSRIYREKYLRTPLERELMDHLAKMSRPDQEAFVKALEDFCAGRITIDGFQARMAARWKGERVQDDMVSIPIVRNAAEFDALTASRAAEAARDVTPEA